MQIIETELFTKQRDDIVFYIAKDKKSVALNFAKELKKAVNNLTNFPYKYRQSYYYQDENIRDMTFSGYSIIYRINIARDVIEILEIFNQNLPEIGKEKVSK
jgi:plasmid stabilization system protein ParE